MAVISTTGQGQGAAQVVKQRPSQMGTIVSSFVDDYLAEQAKQAEAQQKANAIQKEADLLAEGLRGAYSGHAKALEEKIEKYVLDGDISHSDGSAIILNNVKRLRKAQDERLELIKSAPEVNSTFFSADDLGNIIDAPANAVYDLYFGEGAEDSGYKNFNEIEKRGEAIASRQEEKPKQDIPTLIKNKYIPLIKDRYNITIDESLSPDQQNLILKRKISQLPDAAKNEMIDMFLDDKEARLSIYLKYSQAQRNTKSGAAFNNEFIDEELTKIFSPFLGTRETLTEDIQTGGGLNFNFGSGKGETPLFNLSLSEREAPAKGNSTYNQKVITINPKPNKRDVEGTFTIKGKEVRGIPRTIYTNAGGEKFVEIEYEGLYDVKKASVPYSDVSEQLNTRYELNEEFIDSIFSNNSENEKEPKQEENLEMMDANRSEPSNEKTYDFMGKSIIPPNKKDGGRPPLSSFSKPKK